MALVSMGEPVRLEKSSYKARDTESKYCVVCGKELKSQYEWYIIEIVRSTPYERLIKNRTFTLSQFDENDEYNNTKFDSKSGIIRRDAVCPDWHRNRKGQYYLCEDCVDEFEKTLFDLLPC